jgi:2-keto-3-deoxy-L-rhamnonate aldolase RhmA
MRAPRTRIIVGGYVFAGVMLSAALSPGLFGQAGGLGQAGPGHGPGGAPGKATPIAVDPGRPWGWAVRAFMDDANQELYNTTKRKLLEGKQVFSQTITQFDIKAYCEGAQKFDFTRFEMQHSTLRFDEVEKMIAACPRVAATPILRVPDASETNIQHAVDLGVLGVIVPTVDDALEARQIAMFSRFPPIARRSTGGGQAGSIWAPIIQKPKTFRQTINDNMLVIAMIETGVDVVIIGNADFESFSGFPPNSPGYLDLQTRVRNATYLAGKFWGNANPGFSVGNPLAADSRFHLGVPPKQLAAPSRASAKAGQRGEYSCAECGLSRPL